MQQATDTLHHAALEDRERRRRGGGGRSRMIEMPDAMACTMHLPGRDAGMSWPRILSIYCIYVQKTATDEQMPEQGWTCSMTGPPTSKAFNV